MSMWTHVAGSVRLDDLSFLTNKPNTAETIEEILGPICLFEDWNDNTRLPCGSEGSIEYKVYENEGNSIAKFNINFFGDLRDYSSSDIEEIVEWFNKLNDNFNPRDNFTAIRDAILKISVEDGTNVILYFDDEERKIKRINL